MHPRPPPNVVPRIITKLRNIKAGPCFSATVSIWSEGIILWSYTVIPGGRRKTRLCHVNKEIPGRLHGSFFVCASKGHISEKDVSGQEEIVPSLFQ